MTFPTDFTCGGADKSPPFTWTPGPSGTLSYALVLHDTFQTPPFNHWVVWDIPPATTSLPESLPATITVPAGAKQAAGSGMDYLGPCPPGNMVHTYVFTLYALDVATLPGVTASTTTANLVAAIQMHDIASATLTAPSNGK
jgi:Raf kinase inhibitor-like YbhB/YbcL family protein